MKLCFHNETNNFNTVFHSIFFVKTQLQKGNNITAKSMIVLNLA